MKISEFFVRPIPAGASVNIVKVVKGVDNETIFVGSDGKFYHTRRARINLTAEFWCPGTIAALVRAKILDRKEVEEMQARKRLAEKRQRIEHKMLMFRGIAREFKIALTKKQLSAFGQAMRSA